MLPDSVRKQLGRVSSDHVKALEDADEGLAVTLIPVSHGKAAMDLLAAGKTDLAAAAEVPFVLAVLQGQPVGVAATVASVSTEMAVVARRDSGIESPQQLAGKLTVVVANLAPRMLRGEESTGMLLAASAKEGEQVTDGDEVLEVAGELRDV